MDDGAMKLGLLLESAQAQQALAESLLEALKAHVGDLPRLARDEIRATLIEELSALGEDSRQAAETLRRLRHVANLRVMLWSVCMTALSCALPLIGLWWLLPSPHEIESLRERRAALTAAVAALTQQGGRVELRRCGTAQRLCVRVDRKAPAYGAAGDYLVVKGY